MSQLGNEQGLADIIRSKCVHLLNKSKLPKSNFTKLEREALHNLRNDTDIMILPADKGRAVVVMNTKDYDSKALELLSDTNTYTKENKDPTNKYAKKVV